ncbi:hypothetical protein PENSUB_3367 [Penicillium subrubescens]|uniref:Uncharacterized protein n=1 Tax=Penicillium subrubescens TaxID=1316194 RepID=A0A1Q5UF74_9EURO|nr:hypothetical protein PENSUB_3367 [Penicillium subrubescens]
MKELAHCFDVSEQAHRKEHRLTGNKAHVKQNHADYNAFLVARRSELPSVPAPSPLDTKEEKAARFSKRLLRLLPGDEGYITWTLGKRAFSDGVSQVVREAQDDRDSDNDSNVSIGGDELEERTMIDFPLPLEEI